ncbi:MAG: hypothetical protein QOH46_2284 [Solirubrobacteraceae bacterium]|nr:hypothetical protein [Solirubrobacteraceae bacterium]
MLGRRPHDDEPPLCGAVSTGLLPCVADCKAGRVTAPPGRYFVAKYSALT